MNIYAELLDNWCTQFTIYLTSQLARQFYGSPVKTPARGTFHTNSERKHALEYKYTHLFFLLKFGIPLYLLTFLLLKLRSDVYEALIAKSCAVRGLKHLREDKVCFYKN